MADNLEVELDIADQYCSVDDEQSNIDHEMPARPTSRLGFNRAELLESLCLESPKANATSCSGTLEWTRNIFQKIGLAVPQTASDYNSKPNDDMDITSLASSTPESSHTPNPLSRTAKLSPCWATCVNSKEVDDENVIPLSSYEDDNDKSVLVANRSAHSVSVDELDVSARHINRPPIIVPYPTIANSSPDLSATLARQTPSQATLRRHVLDPSRPDYQHHGYSKHALLHLKWFWAVREDEWEEYTTRLHRAQAYSGLSITTSATPPPLRYPDSNSRNENIRDQVQEPHSFQLPPMSIHPRRGDILALRDPYCVHIDRCFVGLPLWTMGKTLWMFDVHMGADSRKGQSDFVMANENEEANANAEDGDTFDDESEGESMETSTSAGFSDDSETTLVEGQSESDMRRFHGRGRGSWENLEADDESQPGASDRKGKHVDLSDEGRSSSLEAATVAQDEDVDPSFSIPTLKETSNANPISSPSSTLKQLPQSAYQCTVRSQGVSRGRPPWATNWYKKWELLVNLARLDREHEVTLEPTTFCGSRGGRSL